MNIIGRTKIWFAISFITILAGIGALIFFNLTLAIDYTGGSLLELSLSKIISKDEIKEITHNNNFENTTITPVGESGVLIRSKPVDQVKKNNLIENIRSKYINNTITELSFETIGPTVSSDLIRKSIFSVIIASIGIIAYIAFAFRKLPDKRMSLRFGATAVIALLHDIIVTIGGFAIVSHFIGWEVDSLFITALLTVMGFSVHDTIVVFDRIRENTKRYPDKIFSEIVNISVVQTFARSLNTSLTILISLGTLLLMGGNTLRPFIFTLFIGIFVGTYSSIFIASPMVVVWQNFINKRLTIGRR